MSAKPQPNKIAEPQFRTINPPPTPPAPAPPAAPPAKNWLVAFGEAMAKGHDLASLPIEPRPTQMGSWMKRADLGMIYAARGVGKTWMSMMLAHALADGDGLGEWAAGEKGSLSVLYVDGEMNLEDSVEREKTIRQMMGGGASPVFLHHEALPDGHCFNLADPEQQESLLKLVKDSGVEVLILDNLSTLCRGVDENDNNAWEQMSHWLRQFRRAGVTVILIHHEGRGGGGARGASKREDDMHWVMRLTASTIADENGAEFTSNFTKCRNCKAYLAPALKWRINSDGVECEKGGDLDTLVRLVNEGYTTCAEISELTDWSKSHTSKLAKRAVDNGQIEKVGRTYKPL